jgi:hypothetical protein
VVAAPADWYRDRPVYVGGDQPVRQVQAWARLQPGFQQLWLDNDRFGWITLAFTSDAEARQVDLQAKFPDVGVVAVEVPTTLAELNALQRRAHRLLDEAGIEYEGSGSSVTQWAIELYVNASDERVTEALAPLAAERICLFDTGAPTPEGPQPQSGDGWRLLGDELVGESYRTGIATDGNQYDNLWRGLRIDLPDPARRRRRRCRRGARTRPRSHGRSRRHRRVHGGRQPARLRRGDRTRPAPRRSVRDPARPRRSAARGARGAHARGRRPLPAGRRRICRSDRPRS